MDSLESRSDEELVEGVGPPGECFAVFYRRHERDLLRFFLSRGGNAEIAADLTAETFAQALASRHRYRRRRGSALGWLFGIAKHVLSRSLRRGQVEDRARRRLGLAPLVLVDEDIEALERLAASEDTDGLRLLAGLPPDQRRAVHLRVLEERDYADIAATLRCSESVVRKRVSRGLTTMRRAMEACE